MNKNIYIFLIPFLLVSCKSGIELPTIEQSQKSIALYNNRIDSLERAVIRKKPSFPIGNDFIIRLSLPAIDKIVETLANNRYDDLSVKFLPTAPVYKEDKSILGISYTNYLNIDNGFLNANLKKFRFDNTNRNKIDATIEVEGKGNISVSGKYMGVPASISPEIELYLYETITFNLIAENNGYVTLKPEPKRMILKSKFYVNLLGWQFPWYQEVPLEISELIEPIKLPISVRPEFMLPLPSSKPGDQKIEYAPYILDFSNSNVTASNNRIEFKSDVNFRPKKK
jgi:hypothetical protein